ncbi:MAG: HlyC/CorC family transporter [Victivallales bacterium]|nr:HlyC/CorC family transporter [Victivallales bacterium]
MLTLILTLIAVLIISGLCSGTEAALFSVPLLRVRELARGEKRSALALLKIREKMNRPITTIVILNNVANIGGSILIGSLAANVLGSHRIGYFSGGFTLLVIIGAEIIPKTIGETHSEKISLAVARSLLNLSRLFTPLVWCIDQITAPFANKATRYSTNEAQIKLLARIGRQEGVIEEDESEMIQRIFDLNDICAEDLMTPRVAITCLQSSQTLGEAKDFIRASQHSRIVVTGESRDEIGGIVFKDELLDAMVDEKYNHPISDFAHPAQFVAESTRADRLLVSFQERRQHLAVVTDEYGGVSGVVSLEDVLEILTGEIVDETDTVVDLQAFAKKHSSH